MQMYNSHRKHSVIGSFTKTKMLIMQFQNKWIPGQPQRLVIYTVVININRTMPIVFAMTKIMRILGMLTHWQHLKLGFTILKGAIFITILMMRELFQLPRLIHMI